MSPSLKTRLSLRKLRTVFNSSSTPSASPRSDSQASTLSPSSPLSTVSPRTRSTPSPFQEFDFELSPSAAMPFKLRGALPLSSSAMDSRRVIRRKKSCVELEQEAERCEVDGQLIGLIEPRPKARVGCALGGIEEVLCGEA
ncbi:hypothetical protein B0A48_02934 [Cryoendolithus antarcticus]|uniref:Uncharacterized protein n=1 Tax=Cryoendolithus antarcticus TaxID=1507870 RepID=A0A1V8TLM5_9PEZI|nr:hypothetical protein B0A48_02934 [Cryoendolithus antarcticus]